MPCLRLLLYPFGMRERETKISDAAILLETAERLATSDPAAALPDLLQALLACREAGGIRCVEGRALSLLGLILYQLGRVDHAAAAFRRAYAADCSCCRPAIDRRFAHFLDALGPARKPEALDTARRAVEAARGPEKGRALVTLGTVCRHAGDTSGTVQALREALDVIPVQSPHHAIALANLGDALRESGKLEDVRRSADILLGLPDRFKGLKYMTMERAKVDWSLGQTLALLVRLSPDMPPEEARATLLQAHDLIAGSFTRLAKLGLLLELAAARVDLANVQAMLDPFEVLDTLEGIPAKGEQGGKRFDLSEVKTAAMDAAAGVFSSDRVRLIWEALRALRDATVEAGATPPVMSYAAL